MSFILLNMGQGFDIIVNALLWVEVIFILISLILYKVLHSRKHRGLIAALTPFIISLFILEGQTCYMYFTDSPKIKDFDFIFSFKLALVLSVFPMFIIFVISIIRYFYAESQNE